MTATVAKPSTEPRPSLAELLRLGAEPRRLILRSVHAAARGLLDARR